MKNLIFGIILALSLVGCAPAQNGDEQSQTTPKDKYERYQVVYEIPDCIPLVYRSHDNSDDTDLVHPFQGEDIWVQDKYLSDKCPSKN